MTIDLEQAFSDGGFEKAGQPPASISLRVGINPEFGFPAHGFSLVFDWNGYRCDQSGEVFRFTFQDWRLFCSCSRNNENRLVTLALTENALARPVPESFLRMILMWCFRRLGWFESHAGCVAREGSGYVLFGSSGSGKSSTVLALIEQGWDFVSDDSILLTPPPPPSETDPFHIYTFRRFFSLRPDTAERCALAPPPSTGLGARAKIQIEPNQLWPHRSQPGVVPRFLLFLKRTGEPLTWLRSLTASEALTRMVPSSLWVMLDRGTSAAHLAAFRRLAHSCYGFELLLGTDVLNDRSQLARLLDAEHLTRLAKSVPDHSQPCSTPPN